MSNHRAARCSAVPRALRAEVCITCLVGAGTGPSSVACRFWLAPIQARQRRNGHAPRGSGNQHDPSRGSGRGQQCEATHQGFPADLREWRAAMAASTPPQSPAAGRFDEGLDMLGGCAR